MKTLTQKTGFSRSIANKVLIGLIFASLISLLSPSTAFADRDKGHRGGHQGSHGNRGNHNSRGKHHNNRGYRSGYNYNHNYNYAQPVYVPPPVYYAPQQSPGINLFLPLNLR
ncbi:hypothetical protein [Methylobacter psychrophilus]|uniref:hypothetical protein n=1 Tax=Methylobacter psychrophilus TaxID=96941 RepID=UPI0021D4D065|nr:hypothetical protein [Methylobacter psychrophilus]